MSDDSEDRTASLMTPAKLAQLKERPRTVASPAAWLDQLASDAGSGHVRRLVELRGQLEEQLRGVDYRGAAAAAQALSAVLDELDFSGLQPRGWLARATGKGKEAAAGFVVQADRASRAGEDLADEVRELHKRQQAQASAVERTVLEVEVEARAVEKIMDQGARWLQDMRTQLKARGAQAGDAAARELIRQDTVRCDLLLARLKQLRAVSTAAHQAVESCRSVGARRAALLLELQQLQETPWKAWHKRITPVVDEVKATGSAAEADRARAALRDLQSAVKRAGEGCAALQAQEQGAAEVLAALQAPLQAAA